MGSVKTVAKGPPAAPPAPYYEQCVVEKRERKRNRAVCYGERQKSRHDHGEGQPDVRGLHCHPGPCDIQACAAAEVKSGSVALRQSGSGLMSMTCVTITGREDARGLAATESPIDVQGSC